MPPYTPSIPQQAILSKQILSRTPTELQYVERSVFMKEVNIQNLWSFELGTQEGINVPIRQEIGKIHRIQTMIRFIDIQQQALNALLGQKLILILLLS